MNPAGRPAATSPIGVRLRTLRMAKGWSVRSLARTLHMTPHAIYQWEVGTRVPTVDKVEAYLRAIGESITIGVPQ